MKSRLPNLLSANAYGLSRKKRGLPGGSARAVIDAANAGRIPSVVVGGKRLFDPERCDKAWIVNTADTNYSMENLGAVEVQRQEMRKRLEVENDDLLGTALAIIAATRPGVAAVSVNHLAEVMTRIQVAREGRGLPVELPPLSPEDDGGEALFAYLGNHLGPGHCAM